MKSIAYFSRLSVVFLQCLCVNVLAGQETAEVERDPMEGRSEKKFTMKFETTQHKLYCTARLSMEYIQHNTMASVAGTIENGDCGASSGVYTLSVRYRDENGETQNVEHLEQWQREDDQAYAFEHEYPIGEDVDLIRVRARKIQCICAEIPAEAVEPANKGEVNE